MGPYWAHIMPLKPAISDIAAFFGYVGAMLGPCWVIWDHVGPVRDHGSEMGRLYKVACPTSIVFALGFSSGQATL